MPKIQVNEKDLSWYYRQRESGQLTVFMPGIATFGPFEPTLVDSTNFVKTYGESSVYPKDLSYDMARSFVESGINVLFWRIDLGAQTAYALLQGTPANNSNSTNDPLLKGESNTEIPHADAVVLTTSDILVKAKYKGTFGNNFGVKIKGTGGLRTLYIYDKRTNQVIETSIVDLVNPRSEYWYQNINEISNYIEIKINDSGFDKSTVFNNASVQFIDGLDYPTSLAVTSIPTKVADTVAKYQTGQSVISPVLKDLEDKLAYTFNIIVNGGYNNIPENTDSISAVDDALVSLAEKRGDAIYLVDGTQEMDSESFYGYTSLPTLESEATSYQVSLNGFNTSYAAAFGPWCRSYLMSDGSIRLLPGSYVFLVRWGQSLANGSPIWMAPAGVKRASLDGIVVDPTYRVGTAVLDMWQNHDKVLGDTPHKVNPIMKLKQYGYVIYGNSTLLHDRYDGATSMLQSFSTRVLANIIKSRAFDISLSLQFDQVDDDLFAEFKTLLTVFMDQLKYGGALYDYQIVADRSKMTLDDLNSRTIPVRIMISPNPAAENFIIDLEISQAGVTFGGDTTSNTVEA